MERGKISLAELLVVSVIGFAAYILIERHTRAPETLPPAPPPHATEHVAPPAKEEVARPSVAPLPAPEVEPAIAAAPDPVPSPAAPAPVAPTQLDSDAILRGVAGVKPAIQACGPRYHDACGLVKLHVHVDPDGSVSSVDIDSTQSQRLAKCASQAMMKATFPASDEGVSFIYPFNFGCH